MKNYEEQKKELPKGCLTTTYILILIVAGFLAYSFFYESDKDIAEKEKQEQIANTPYTELLGLEKKKLSEKLLNAPSIQTGFVLAVQDRVKKYFKNPATVDFPMGESLILEKFQPISWDEGKFRYVGDVTAKNSFGVVTSHKYQVDISIKNKKVELLDIKVE